RALAAATVRTALPLEGRADAAAGSAGGLSSSASRAPRGSEAIAAIDPGRGPMPNRCSASRASAVAEVLMAEASNSLRRAVMLQTVALETVECKRGMVAARRVPGRLRIAGRAR